MFRFANFVVFLATVAAFAPTLTQAFGRTVLKMANIVDTASSAGSFNTLSKAIAAAGLADTLKAAPSGSYSYTVFAPTDAAFDALPAGTLDSILSDKDKLTELLLMHVVAGQKNPTRNGQSFQTLCPDESGFKEIACKVTVDTAEVNVPKSPPPPHLSLSLTLSSFCTVLYVRRQHCWRPCRQRSPKRHQM